MYRCVMPSVIRFISSVGSLSHCSSKEVGSLARAAAKELKAPALHPRESQTCSIGFMFSDRADQTHIQPSGQFYVTLTCRKSPNSSPSQFFGQMMPGSHSYNFAVPYETCSENLYLALEISVFMLLANEVRVYFNCINAILHA
ncbi:hypothetical protein TNCV_3735991 [Trichonephila clavipes]|nr:hypothetical protein TNCV_3735991 [Trichonephila clavipes]